MVEENWEIVPKRTQHLEDIWKYVSGERPEILHIPLSEREKEMLDYLAEQYQKEREEMEEDVTNKVGKLEDDLANLILKTHLTPIIGKVKIN
jgi:hypothetical protein